jgi:hypothetical protein
MKYTRTLETELGRSTALTIESDALSVTVITQSRSNIRVELSADQDCDDATREAINSAELLAPRSGGLQLIAHAPRRQFSGYNSGSVVIGGNVYGSFNTSVNYFGSGRASFVTTDHIDVVVYVPQYFTVDAQMRGGSLHVSGPIGEIRGDLSGGDVKFDDADHIDLDLSGGSLRGRDVLHSVEVRSSGGNVSLDRIGGNVHVRSSGGNIKVGELAGSGSMKTSGGNIKLGGFSGEMLTLNTSGGNIEHPEHIGISAKTSGGKVNGKQAKLW